MTRKITYISSWVASLLFPQALFAEPVFKTGDVLAICGDSITEQKLYSVYIEDYILMCQPITDVKTLQCGWGGATARHFAGHMKNDVLTFSPTVATTSYGMNDGGYSAISPNSEMSYSNGMTGIVEAFKNANTRVVIIGSPGAVDTSYFKNYEKPDVTATVYNRTLGRLGEIAKEIATTNGLLFADVHTALIEAMTKAKAKLGADYPITGNHDGVHPGPPGHIIMAYAYLIETRIIE